MSTDRNEPISNTLTIYPASSINYPASSSGTGQNPITSTRPRYNFQPFPRRTGRSGPTAPPQATISRRGTITLNEKARNALGPCQSVRLLYDPDARAIGISPARPDDPEAYALRNTNKGFTTVNISATTLCRHYDIIPAESTRYTAALEDGILIIDLTQTGTPVGRPATRER